MLDTSLALLKQSVQYNKAHFRLFELGAVSRQFFLSLFFLCLLSACSSYERKIDKPFGMLVNHNPLGAADLLKEPALRESDDQLVYLMEYGVALHEAGQYDESIKIFLKAYDIAEIKDFHSISKITASLLLSEGMIQYKGEDFEKVLINVYLAINFLMLGKFEDAAVEARRVNEILYKFKNEAKRDYTQNPFARYISAIIWENERNWDSMYIDYKNAYDLAPAFAPLQKDLLWGSKRASRPDAYAQWKKSFKDVEADKLKDDKSAGELIFIYQQGLGPQKRPDPGFPRVPHLYPRPTSGTQAKIEIISDSKTVDSLTSKIFSVSDTAIKTLNDQYAGLIAKRLGGVAVKAVAADQIRQKNKLLGDVAWIAMNIADQADLRHWATLPESFQVARQMLKAGKYKVRVAALNSSGQPTGEMMEEKEIEIKPRTKVFLTWRSFK